MMKKRSFTLVEIVVSAVILALTFGGLLAAFTGARAYVARAERRLTAANNARAWLNTLYMEVRQDTWDDSANKLANPVFTGDSNWTDDFERNYTRFYDRADETGKEYRGIYMDVGFPGVSS